MSDRKKILLLADDMRMQSGIARMSREMVLGTCHKYDWVQIGGAIKHPEAGKRIDIESDENFSIPKEAKIVIYPTDGYGNPNLLREVLVLEKPDAILHFTDPRFWIWLYNMEHEIRTKIPLMYLNIWDDLPDPLYNTNFYRSCDSLMSISKQTYGINKRILSHHDYEDWQTTYVPHGISEERLFKIKDSNLDYKKFCSSLKLDEYKFKILYLNRNIRRKQPGDVILAYKHFMDKLTPEQRKECCLVFHCNVSDENGTDLRAISNTLIPEYPVIFTHDVKGPLDDISINYLYNSVDVYMNLASNEGFGLGSAEALMTETPIIVNVTGGLQDQCGFKKEDGTYLTADDYVELGSNHRGKYKEHGEWVKPVFPSNISLQGSPLTPYIFDDRADYRDAGEALLEWYKAGPEERERCGESGREFLLDPEISMSSTNMSKKYLEHFEKTFNNFKPREKYTLEAV